VDPVYKYNLSNYSVMSGNPISRKDPNGDNDYEYVQQKDRSWKKREDVENDGGEQFHTFKYLDGTLEYVKIEARKANSAKVDPAEMKKYVDSYSENMYNNTVKAGQILDNIGAGVEFVGYMALPFSAGFSGGLIGAGKVTSVLGMGIEHRAKYKYNAELTTEQLIDLTIDLGFLSAPIPFKKLIDKTPLDKQTKKYLEYEIEKVNIGLEKANDQVIKNKENDE